MKKLMIAAAIICAAAMAQASSFNWKTKAANAINLPETTTQLASGTAYLFAYSTTGAGATVLPSTFVEAFSKGNAMDFSAALDSSSVSNGKITAKTGTEPPNTPFNYGADGDNSKFYYVILTGTGDDQMLYISDLQNGDGQQGRTITMTFVPGSSTNAAAKALDAKAGYVDGAHWYTAAVPEPTSGLLLLLGVAGLALRRRRA